MTLFVGNLSYGVDENGLRAAFEGLGVGVSAVKIPVDRDTGRPRGFGFVDITGDAQAAIETANGALVGGRPIRVAPATERLR